VALLDFLDAHGDELDQVGTILLYLTGLHVSVSLSFSLLYILPGSYAVTHKPMKLPSAWLLHTGFCYSLLYCLVSLSFII
jgi:hypothetical protein